MCALSHRKERFVKLLCTTYVAFLPAHRSIVYILLSAPYLCINFTLPKRDMGGGSRFILHYGWMAPVKKKVATFKIEKYSLTNHHLSNLSSQKMVHCCIFRIHSRCVNKCIIKHPIVIAWMNHPD